MKINKLALMLLIVSVILLARQLHRSASLRNEIYQSGKQIGSLLEKPWDSPEKQEYGDRIEQLLEQGKLTMVDPGYTKTSRGCCYPNNEMYLIFSYPIYSIPTLDLQKKVRLKDELIPVSDLYSYEIRVGFLPGSDGQPDYQAIEYRRTLYLKSSKLCPPGQPGCFHIGDGYGIYVHWESLLKSITKEGPEASIIFDGKMKPSVLYPKQMYVPHHLYSKQMYVPHHHLVNGKMEEIDPKDWKPAGPAGGE